MKNFAVQLKKIDWYNPKDRDLDIAHESLYLWGRQRKFFKRLGINYALKNELGFDNGKIYYDQAEMDAISAIMFKNSEKGFANLSNEITKNFKGLAKIYQSFVVSLQKKDISNLNKNELGKIYDQYLDTLGSLMPYSVVISIIFAREAPKIIMKYLNAKTRNPEQVYAKLMVPFKESDASREYQDRLKLALLGRSKNRSDMLERALNRHLNKFEYLPVYTPTDLPFTLKTLKSQVTELIKGKKDFVKELKSIKSKHQAATHIATKELSRFKLPKHIKQLIKIMQDNIWLRTERKEIMAYGFYRMLPVHERIVKIAGVNFIDLKQVACWETAEFLQGKKFVSKVEIKNRKQAFFAGLLNHKVFLVSGKKVIQYKKLMSSNTLVANTNQVKGAVAYKAGVVSGRVQQVYKRTEMPRFKKESVLVAHTVATWMTPVVEKCKAIVVDAGGVLSHTAVVAREYSIPTIMGTKNATEVFKSGDLIEVNTTTGIATKK